MLMPDVLTPFANSVVKVAFALAAIWLIERWVNGGRR